MNLTTARRAAKDGSDASWFAAVAHPVRIRILWRFLVDTNVILTPKTVADEFGEPLGVVSYHVRVLHEHRILRLVKKTLIRGAVEHHYRLQDPYAVATMLWGSSASLLQIGHSSCGRLQNLEGNATVVVDETGLDQISASTDRYLADLAQIHEASQARVGAEATSSEATRQGTGTAQAGSATYRVAILVGVDDDRYP